MAGLLRKDFYMMMKYCWSFLLIALLFLGVSAFSDGNTFFVLYPVIFAAIVPVTLLSYDESSGWNLYADALPLKRARLVAVKYLDALILMLLFWMLSFAAQAVRLLILNSGSWCSLTELMMLVMSIGFLTPALMLPFLFWLGSTKGRMIYLIAIVAVCGGSSALSTAGEVPIFGAWFLPAAVLASALLYAASYFLSVRLYQGREL